MAEPIDWQAFLLGDAEVRIMVTRLAVRAPAAGLADFEVGGILGLAGDRWRSIRDGTGGVLSRDEERGVRLLGDVIGYAALLLGSDAAVELWLRRRSQALGERPIERLIRDPGALAWMRNQLEREYLDGGGL